MSAPSTQAVRLSDAGATTCEVCDRTATGRHPCRFERACACWYGVPCQPAGARYKAPKRIAP